MFFDETRLYPTQLHPTRVDRPRRASRRQSSWTRPSRPWERHLALITVYTANALTFVVLGVALVRYLG